MTDFNPLGNVSSHTEQAELTYPQHYFGGTQRSPYLHPSQFNPSLIMEPAWARTLHLIKPLTADADCLPSKSDVKQILESLETLEEPYTQTPNRPAVCPKADSPLTAGEMANFLETAIALTPTQSDGFDTLVIRHNTVRQLDPEASVAALVCPESSEIDLLQWEPPPVVHLGGYTYYNVGITSHPVIYNLVDALVNTHSKQPHYEAIFQRIAYHSQGYGLQGELFMEDLTLLKYQLKIRDDANEFIQMAQRFTPDSPFLQEISQRLVELAKLNHQLDLHRYSILEKLSEFYVPL